MKGLTHRPSRGQEPLIPYFQGYLIPSIPVIRLAPTGVITRLERRGEDSAESIGWCGWEVDSTSRDERGWGRGVVGNREKAVVEGVGLGESEGDEGEEKEGEKHLGDVNNQRLSGNIGEDGGATKLMGQGGGGPGFRWLSSLLRPLPL